MQVFIKLSGNQTRGVSFSSDFPVLTRQDSEIPWLLSRDPQHLFIIFLIFLCVTGEYTYCILSCDHEVSLSFCLFNDTSDFSLLRYRLIKDCTWHYPAYVNHGIEDVILGIDD